MRRLRAPPGRRSPPRERPAPAAPPGPRRSPPRPRLAPALRPPVRGALWPGSFRRGWLPPTGAGAEIYRVDGATPVVQTATAITQTSETGFVATATGDLNGAVGDSCALHWVCNAEL